MINKLRAIWRVILGRPIAYNIELVIMEATNCHFHLIGSHVSVEEVRMLGEHVTFANVHDGGSATFERDNVADT